MINQMLGKMHVVLENVIQTKYECQSEGKVKKRKYENEIFPDRDPHSRSNQRWILFLVDVEFEERKRHRPKRGRVKKVKSGRRSASWPN